MAKKKQEGNEKPKPKRPQTSQDLIKKLGAGAFITGAQLEDSQHDLVHVSPKLDLVLGGGIPGGSVVTIAGDPKCGKTLTSLHILAKAQLVNRPVYFLNVEGRIKTRDLKGIKGLDLDKLNIVRSYKDENGKTRILTAREFLTAAEHTIHNVPGAVIVIDSISQLATDKELELELGEMDRASGAILMAKFCKRLSNVIPINDIILVGIQHFISNVSGMGKWKIASGGRKIQYACDVGLECKKFAFIHEGGEEGPVIGQTVDWITTSTALNAAPGQKTTSVIRYGIGIDELQEIVDIGIDFGFIEQRGTWFRLNFAADADDDFDPEIKDAWKPYQVQGKENLTNRLRESEAEFKLLEFSLHEMMGA